MSAASDPGLVAVLDRPPSPPLPAGSRTAVFLLGACFHRSERVEGLEIVLDGRRHAPTAFGMPRPDVPGSPLDPDGRGRRSGFWATVPVHADRPGTIDVEVAARLAGGGEAVARLAGIDVVEEQPLATLPPAGERAPGELIAVCMATFEPDAALFEAQVESLRAQTDESWVCVISDDCSRPERFAEIERIVGDDPRFEVSRSPERLGFYRNFERALRLAPPQARLLALSDQDDRWHPDKLATLRAAIGGATLAYSDQRLTDASGRVLRETMWKGRRNNHTDFASELIANTITGAATLFRRDVADAALPFPDTPGFQFHDQWLGVVAMALGDVAYVDRPLYDYVQHAGAIFGDVSQGRREGLAARLRAWAPRPGHVVEGWRAAYFYGYLSREVQAQTLLVRCGDRLPPDRRRVLERFVACQRSPAAFAWLAGRPLRELMGRNETLGSEVGLAAGIAWRRLVAPRADASFPPPAAYNQRRLRRWRARV